MVDVAVDARLSRSTVSRSELGTWDGLTFGSLEAIASALGARLTLVVQWNGAELDRAIDEGHARLTAVVIDRLGKLGWTSRVEVSYSVFGERGSIDVLAWHAATDTLLVIEVKTELGSVEGLLRPLDAKVRLASRIARRQLGWNAARVAAIVVFPEVDAVRRQVKRHVAVLEVALPATSREIGTWLRRPTGAVRGRWFISDSRRLGVNPNPSSIRRVRAPARAGTER